MAKYPNSVLRGVELLNHRTKNPPISTEKSCQMVMDLFKELEPLLFEGYVLKTPFECGEFSMACEPNYYRKKIDYVKTRQRTDGKIVMETIYPEFYYIFWAPGELKWAIHYRFNHLKSMKSKISKMAKSGKKLIAFNKDFKGQVRELATRR